MGRIVVRVLACLFVLFTWHHDAAAQDPQALRIIRITPEGKDVSATRQIVLEFNRPVVPIGAMERSAAELGITVSPALSCQWRWLNTSSLSCNLGEKEALEKATTYKIHVEPRITAEDGGKLAEAYDHQFTTTLPRVEGVNLRIWEKPGTPLHRVNFTDQVTKSSAAAHIYYEDETTKTRYAVDISPDKEEYDNRPPVIRDGEEARWAWLVSPKQELPLNSKIVLKEEAGLVPAKGSETGSNEGSVYSFVTFPEFKFKGIVCQTNDNRTVYISPETPQTDDMLCNPMTPVRLSFTSTVLRSVIRDYFQFTPGLDGGRKDYKPWGDDNMDWSRLDDGRTEEGREYMIGLPVGLKAAQDYTISIEKPKFNLWAWIKSFFTRTEMARSNLKDEFGRSLPPFTLKFSTNHRPPNYELIYNSSILEKSIDSELPLYVNNLQSYALDYKTLTVDGLKEDKLPTTALPQVQDVQFAIPMELRKLLNGKSGAIAGTLTTTPYVEKWSDANFFFSQVTPYQAYLKLGHYKSSLWVTDLATGQPVGDADIEVYVDTISDMKGPTASLAIAKTDGQGLASLPGTDTLTPDLSYKNVWQTSQPRLFVRIVKGDDIAILPVHSDYEVSIWNISSDMYADNEKKYGHMKSWGTTAQGIYRAGDTMEYKIYVRDQDNNGFIKPDDLDMTLEITDPAGKVVDTVDDVKLSAFGTVDGTYKIPETAAVGWYSFKLSVNTNITSQNGDGEDNAWRDLYPLSVLVSDFTPAPFRVSTELNGEKFKAGDKLDVTATAALHSGGAYTDSSVRNTISLKSRSFISKNPNAKDYSFNSFVGEQDSEDIFQTEEKLNDKGAWEGSFTLPEKQIAYGKLFVESAVRDDRGKSIASMASADYAGVDRLVGLLQTDWVYPSQKPATVKTIVVDDAGNPVSGTPVTLTIEKQEIVTAKVKEAGNAYTNDNTEEWIKKADCNVTSAAEGQDCTFTPDSAGTYRITAVIQDTKGRTHQSQQTMWVTGSDYVQWDSRSEYALTILPERTDYKVGDTARFLIKNPYPGAMAQISIERYGVLDSFAQKLEGSAPVIEVPVKEDYLPGFYLSVVIVSPRVESPPSDASQIDLGKPTFRAGYVKVPVLDPYKQMSITAKAEQDVYRPGDLVRVSIDAKPLHPKEGGEPIELAITVLDESVFDLLSNGKNTFDPYHGFYDLDDLDVTNYSLLTRLVGRQKFEKKGANVGGDGGSDAGMRNLFKFVSYWNPSVPVDKDGHATIEFKAPDNLTGWRILAMAVTPTDRMGLDDATFKVNRPTEIRPVMPNQIREGDLFSAGFSVMNRTDHKRDIKVTIHASGDVKGQDVQTKEETLSLEPYKRATVLMPLETNLLSVQRDLQEGRISFEVTAGDAEDRDGLKHSIPLLKSRTLQTAANYGTTTENTAQESIAFPKDILTDSGDLSVVLSPSVIANLDGAFRYMRDYEYPCWEQKLTTAVMAAHYISLKPYLGESVSWPETQTLPQTLLDAAASYQAPNGGMAYFKAQDEYVDPYLSAYTALAFKWMKAAGYDIPEDVEYSLNNYLVNFLKKDTAPDYYQDGMTSTVRAVILSALADTGKITKDDILRFRSHVKDMSLFGKAQYLKATSYFPETKDAARETVGMILSSGVESGGKFAFNETYDDGYERILATPLRDNCAILDSLLTYPDKDLIGDKPFKLVRMITQSRGNRDHWENTQENVFCMNSLVDYAKAYEAEDPNMTVSAAYNGQQFGNTKIEGRTQPSVTLTRNIEPSDAGTKGTMTLSREGQGRLYYSTRLRYAAPSPENVNAGIDIKREYSVKKDGKWTLVQSPVTIARGDLVKVDLFVSVPRAANFLVVNDPLPGGLETINRDLATASTVDADQAAFDEAGGSIWFKFNDWKEYNFSRWSFYHKELRHDSARFYADWLDPGNYHLSYMAQAIATGTFAAPPTKAEEMYDPDVYGLGGNGELIVQETP